MMKLFYSAQMKTLNELIIFSTFEMPEVDEDVLLEGLKQLVDVERD